VFNEIELIGRLGKDAETGTFKSGDTWTSFSVATEHTYKVNGEQRSEGTIWWNCQLMGKRGDALAPYLKKGTMVRVSGRCVEKQGKDERKFLNVQVDKINFIPTGKKDDSPQSPTGSHGDAGPGTSTAGVNLDEIPF
jgi:single-strand DNA-binding protein